MLSCHALQRLQQSSDDHTGDAGKGHTGRIPQTGAAAARCRARNGCRAGGCGAVGGRRDAEGARTRRLVAGRGVVPGGRGGRDDALQGDGLVERARGRAGGRRQVRVGGGGGHARGGGQQEGRGERGDAHIDCVFCVVCGFKVL